MRKPKKYERYVVKDCIESSISKQEFILLVEELKKKYDETMTIVNILEDTIGSCDKFYNAVFNGYDFAVNQLAERLKDNEDNNGYGWLDWWVYDNNWGRGGLNVIIDDKVFEVNDAETLWNVIMEE